MLPCYSEVCFLFMLYYYIFVCFKPKSEVIIICIIDYLLLILVSLEHHKTLFLPPFASEMPAPNQDHCGCSFRFFLDIANCYTGVSFFTNPLSFAQSLVILLLSCIYYRYIKIVLPLDIKYNIEVVLFLRIVLVIR